MKGWRTVAFGVATAILPPAIAYMGNIDWASLGITPKWSVPIGAIIVALRYFTDTEIGKSA